MKRDLLYAWRVSSVLAVTGTVLATVAGPARAGEIVRGDPISAAFADVEVPVGGVAIDQLGPDLWSTGPMTVTGARVVYDLRGVAGVRLTPDAGGGGTCRNPSPARVVCTDPRVLSFEGETIERYLPVVVTAAGTAGAGDTGTVTVTFSAAGLAPITGTSRVRVVDGRQDLAATGTLAGWIGGVGVWWLGAGVLAVLAARRRRARFVTG